VKYALNLLEENKKSSVQIYFMKYTKSKNIDPNKL